MFRNCCVCYLSTVVINNPKGKAWFLLMLGLVTVASVGIKSVFAFLYYCKYYNGLYKEIQNLKNNKQYKLQSQRSIEDINIIF